MSTATFHEGRDKVTFGSFLLEALKRKRDVPSPDRYSPKIPYSTIGGKMGTRITTDPSMRTKDVPGPGAYQLKSIQLENRGHYALSTIKYSFCSSETQLLRDISQTDLQNCKKRKNLRLFSVFFV
jgi:hypothetical protein